MIGQSKAHKRLVEEINLVGGSDLTVLITGETGVGKELVAQAIHAASARADLTTELNRLGEAGYTRLWTQEGELAEALRDQGLLTE